MQNWKKLLIDKKTTIKKVLELFETNNVQIAFVTQNNKLLGTVTDGDIRRALLEIPNLGVCVDKIMNGSPIVLPINSSEEEIKLKIKKHFIRYLPLVDKKGCIKGVYSDIDFERYVEILTPVVIMAGGEGRRLRPLTESVPKPMVDLNGKPIIERVIIDLISYGFRNFYISINYLGEIIEKHFGDGNNLGISITYLKEDRKLGTAGSLSLLKDIKDDFLVINGDLVTNLNFKNMLTHHKTEKAMATVAVKRASFKVPYGVILNDLGKITSIEEKPIINYNVNCGIYVFSPSIFGKMNSVTASIDMPSLLRKIIQDDELISAYSIYENWYDIADINDLEKVRNVLL